MDNKERFLSLCSEIRRDGVENLMKWIDSSDFYEAPASSNFHCSHKGGLLEHSLNVYDELKRLLAAYPEVEVSNDSVIICSLFHDLCKANTYSVEMRNRKNEQGQWEQYEYYARKEKFHFGGHGSKSLFIIQNFMWVSPEEAVAINCHMGAFDNSNVGESYEQYPFAWLLHVADESATFLVERRD